MLHRKNWRGLAAAMLVWVVMVAGAIGGVVPPVEASVDVVPVAASAELAGLPTATAGFVAAATADGRVPALALARFGSGLAADAAVVDRSVGPAPLQGILDDPEEAPLDPTDFDEIEEEMLDRVKQKADQEVKRPGFDVWPGFEQLQLVGLNTWFAVDDEAWVRDVTVSEALEDIETLTAVGSPVRVEYEFAGPSGTETRFCRQQGIEYSVGADRTLACVRTWEHTTEVEPLAVRARLVYAFEWELFEAGAITESGTFPIVGEWSESRDLVIGELGTVASDGTAPAQVRPDRGDGVDTLEVIPEGSTGCGWNIFCHAGRAATALWEWGQQQWDNLSSGLIQVARTVWSLGVGCFSNIVDVFIALKDVVSKVVAFTNDPVAFIQEQIEVVQQLLAAMQEDAYAFVEELFLSAVEADLWQTNRTEWIGKFGCQLVVALFTGGGSLLSRVGGVTRLIEKVTDFLNSRGRTRTLDRRAIDDNPNDPNRRDDDDDTENGDDLNLVDCRFNNSFPSGTQVRMANGTLTSIDRIEPGDHVLAADPETGQWSPQRVLDQWSHLDTGHLATAVLADGSAITATDHHRFWVATTGEWVELDNIQPGDLLLSPNGVTSVTYLIVHPASSTLVWELDTTGPDTFTVHTGSKDVLVHNATPCQGADDTAARLGEDGLDVTAEEVIQAWERYLEDNPDADFDTWQGQYERIRRNNFLGNQHELDILAGYNPPITNKNGRTFPDPEGGADFKPDAVIGTDPPHFVEVKDYVDTVLYPGSNAGKQLRYLIDDAIRTDNPGTFDLHITDPSNISQGMQNLIDEAVAQGVTVNINP